MTRPDRSETAPITLAGWYDPLQIERSSSCGRLYGYVLRRVAYCKARESVWCEYLTNSLLESWVPQVRQSTGHTALISEIGVGEKVEPPF